MKFFGTSFKVVIMLAHHIVLLQINESLSLQANLSQRIGQVSEIKFVIPPEHESLPRFECLEFETLLVGSLALLVLIPSADRVPCKAGKRSKCFRNDASSVDVGGS